MRFSFRHVAQPLPSKANSRANLPICQLVDGRQGHIGRRIALLPQPIKFPLGGTATGWLIPGLDFDVPMKLSRMQTNAGPEFSLARARVRFQTRFIRGLNCRPPDERCA
jgi:hypothetical protein